MDRNTRYLINARYTSVALRKESVDRNLSFRAAAGFRITVALRKESVDRNFAVSDFV